MLFGVWPFVVRRLVGVMASSDCVGLNVEQLGCHMVVSLVVCEDEKVQVMTLCTVPCNAGWELRLAEWLADYWSVIVDDPHIVGGAYSCFPLVGELRDPDSARSAICVKSVLLEDITKLVSNSVVGAFGGQAIDVLVTFLVTKLRDEVVHPALTNCPTLLRVSIQV